MAKIKTLKELDQFIYPRTLASAVKFSDGTSLEAKDFASKDDVPTKTSELTNDSGYLTDQSLETYAKKTDVPTKTSQLTNDSKFAEIDDMSTKSDKVWSASKVAQSISDIEMAKSPNVTVIGQPTYANGQFSGFDANNYLQFPFMVDFKGLPFTIDLETTTGSEVNNQHNILDSAFGLAFAVRNSRFVIAISTNGTSWNIGEGIGTHAIQPNSTYRVRMSWDLSNFTLSYSTDGGTTYITDIVKPLTVQPFPKQMLIGITSDKSTFYNGIINLNYSKLTIGGIVVWTGMDASGIDTRADVSLSNLDDIGKQTIKDLAPKVKINGVETSDNNVPYVSQGVAGVTKTSPTYNTSSTSDGYIRSMSNTVDVYQTKSDNAFISKGTLENIKGNYVKEAMTSTTDPQWTEEEKANARKRIGTDSLPLVLDDVLTEDTNQIDFVDLFDESWKEAFIYVNAIADSSTVSTTIFYPFNNSVFYDFYLGLGKSGEIAIHLMRVDTEHMYYELEFNTSLLGKAGTIKSAFVRFKRSSVGKLQSLHISRDSFKVGTEVKVWVRN